MNDLKRKKENLETFQKFSELRLIIITSIFLCGSSVNEICYNGMTPLNAACYYSDIDLAKVLINLGASVNTKNKKGNTLLHTVVNNFTDFNIINLLIDNQANFTFKNKKGITPFDLISEKAINCKEFRKIKQRILKMRKSSWHRRRYLVLTRPHHLANHESESIRRKHRPTSLGKIITANINHDPIDVLFKMKMKITSYL